MATFYSVIQFVPDPVADERINAGVVVFGEGRVLARFVENWTRLQRFGNKDVSFVKQFARELQERVQAGEDRPEVTEASLREMIATWKNAIQFTPPRGSLLGPEELLADTEDRFLANDHPAERRPFTRRYMKKLAFDAACLAFVQRGGQRAQHLVKRNFPIVGAITRHPFSLAISNGKPLVAAEVFSFVGPNEKGQEKDVMATAWAFEDVQKKHSGLKLAALVVQDAAPSPAFLEAEKIFGSLGVEIVPKDSVDMWAEGIAERVLPSSGA